MDFLERCVQQVKVRGSTPQALPKDVSVLVILYTNALLNMQMTQH